MALVRSKKELLRRYAVLFAGLMFNAFGVAFVTKARLGTSPIASIPYSLSLILPRLTIGNWTILFSMSMIAAQIIILKKDANRLELVLQAVMAFVFGYFIDFSMLLLGGFLPGTYPLRLLSLLAGCVVIAFGAYLEVIADVVMLTGDALVRTIARVWSKPYGSVRVASDVSMSVTAGVLCLVFTHRLSGVREGTIIAALITGNILKLYLKKFGRLTETLVPAKEK